MSKPAIKLAHSRFPNEISAVEVTRATESCINCGTCANVCPFGVHERRPGYNRISRPQSHLCIGASCEDMPFYCVNHCPRKALSLDTSQNYKTIGDHRWTRDLILGTWKQAETGMPLKGREYEIGDSGGGFDRMVFKFLRARVTDAIDEDAISTEIDLNKRAGRRISIDVPFYGGGMSFGSISLFVMLARAKAARAWGTFTCTGEGGFPAELQEYDENVITQIATGLFGVSEDTIQRVKIVELKYAQGAKPGLGGHLLGDKVTAEVARLREAVPDSSLFSPFPFHSVYSVEDHEKHVDWIKEINPDAIVSVKVSTPRDVDMVAVGSYYAGANIIHLDGSYGGTGAAPEIAKKNIAMPIEYAITKVHECLKEEGIRDEITVIASGGIRTAHDAAKAITLGADGVVTGTAELVALGCVRCGSCESGRGCPRGIATTDPELARAVDVDWGAQRLINLYAAWRSEIVMILKRLGMSSIKELVGRYDCLSYEGPSKGQRRGR
ncbi:MAG TPA: FMN-binding glutamate synthase family protein [Desulfobacteria bacterium]|nr:FMN-binding glutamate synthase family protein [Desulfobacteria bacterium]